MSLDFGYGKPQKQTVRRCKALKRQTKRGSRMRAGGTEEGGSRGAYQVEGEAGRRRGGAASGAQPRRGRNRSWGGGSRPCPSTARTASSCTPARGREEGPTHPGSRLCPSPSSPPAWLLDAADGNPSLQSRRRPRG